MDLAGLLHDPLRMIEPFLKDRPKAFEFLTVTAAKLEGRLKKYPKNKPSYGICHGDIQAKNMHIDNDGRITIFDFDLCGYNWRAFDLAAFTWNNIKRKPALLKGYRSIRDFSRREILSIKYFEMALMFWAMGFHIQRSRECGGVLNNAYFDFWIDRLKMHE